MDLIDWKEIDVGNKTSGQKKVKCPKCIDRRSNKNDRSLSVNISKGVAKCHYCEAISFRDSIEKETKKEYSLPSQEWINYTNLSDRLVKWFEEERAIPQYVLKHFNITEEKHYQPQLGKEVNNIVFNFFERDTLINKKYRSANKKFTQSAGTKRIFYNINAAVGQKELYIVEGEIDVLSLYVVGIKNVISLPSGAQDNDDVWSNCKDYLDSIDKFIIATDNDEKGIEVREKIAQRLGRYRCEYIEWKNKDANEDLIEGVLSDTSTNFKRFPVSGTFTIDDLYDGVLDLYDNGLPSTIYPKHPCFSNLKDIFSVMRGQLSVGTGIPSHGKSNFTDWYVINLIKDYNLKGSWFSPEHNPMPLYKTNLIEKVIGRNFWKEKRGFSRIDKDEIRQYKEWAKEKIYLTDCEAGKFPTWTWLLDKFKEQMYSFGIDIFVIDAFNKVLLPKGMSKIDAINEVLTKLTSFAQANNVIIFLVAHPTKMSKTEQGVYTMPTLYDVSGSADFRNQTHNGYTIYRMFEDAENGIEDSTEFVNMKTKYNFQGKIGEKVVFKYCDINGRYYADGIEPTFNLINGFEKNVKKDFYINPSDAFDLDNDVPF